MQLEEVRRYGRAVRWREGGRHSTTSVHRFTTALLSVGNWRVRTSEQEHCMHERALKDRFAAQGKIEVAEIARSHVLQPLTRSRAPTGHDHSASCESMLHVAPFTGLLHVRTE